MEIFKTSESIQTAAAHHPDAELRHLLSARMKSAGLQSLKTTPNCTCNRAEWRAATFYCLPPMDCTTVLTKRKDWPSGTANQAWRSTFVHCVRRCSAEASPMIAP